MFQSQFIKAAGLDYRKLNSKPSVPHEQPHMDQQINNSYTSQLSNTVIKLRQQLEMQNIEIEENKHSINILRNQLFERMGYIQFLEAQLNNWKERIIQFQNEEKERGKYQIDRITEEDHQDQGQSFKIYSDLNDFGSPISSQNVGSSCANSPYLQFTANSPFVIYKTNSKDHQQRITLKHRTSITRKFKTLVKISVQNIILSLHVLGLTKHKQTLEPIIILQQNISKFAQDFNEKYYNLKHGALNDHEQARITRILKEYSSEIKYVYGKISKTFAHFGIESSKKMRMLESTARK